MGFFSKVWKGIKGTFKKIGKGIKKTFNKFGKFMGKIGILGQVAMMFILPGIGNALMGSVMNLASWGAQAGGIMGGIAKGAAWTLGKAQQFAKLAKGAFNTVTKPITQFFKTAGNYVGSKLQSMGVPMPKGWDFPKNYTLEQAKTDWWQEGVVKNWNTFKGESSNFFSTSIESVLPETGPSIDLGKDQFGEEQTLLSDPAPMTPREEKLFGEGKFRENYRIEHQLPARGGLPAPPPSIGYPDESRISEILKHTEDGVYTPPDPTAPPSWAQKGLGKRAYEFPGQVIETTKGQLTSDVGKSLLAGEKVGTLTYFDDPQTYTPRSRIRGTFEADPAPLAEDQNLTAFMSFEDDYGPPDPFGLWGGKSNYRDYLNRFAPTQLKYA